LLLLENYLRFVALQQTFFVWGGLAKHFDRRGCEKVTIQRQTLEMASPAG
jgi:hypothetical protein